MKLRLIRLFALWVSLSLFAFGFPGVKAAATETARKRIIILTTGESVAGDRAYADLFSLIGLQPEMLDMNDLTGSVLENTRILVLPGRTAEVLSEAAQSAIIEEMDAGLDVITETKTPLALKLGIKFQERQQVDKAIVDLKHPQVPIQWEEDIPLDAAEGDTLSVFCKTRDSGYPVLAGGTKGKGRFLYLSVPFCNEKQPGYFRYPYLHETVSEYFQINSPVKRRSLITYLDWGYHYGENPAALAAKLRSEGIAEVHLSAWYSLNNCGTFYKEFITACHANGLLVYAWFELPMVTAEFWNAHPEWREKTATGAEAHIDWRYLMALEIPECMGAVKKEIRQYLDAFDWDGADMAELYFESPGGLENPESYTPMSASVRHIFQGKSGIDPVEIFDPKSPNYFGKNEEMLGRWTDYRVALCTALNREVVEFVKTLESRLTNLPYDIYVTQIDSFMDIRMRQSIGVDSGGFADLQKELGFTLQVEDPYSLWSTGPERYEKIGGMYAGQLGDNRNLSVDISIVDRSNAPFPTRKQTGLELLSLFSSASRSFDNLCIYAANTAYAHDYPYISRVLGSRTEVNEISRSKYSFSSPYDFIFETKATGQAYLDGSLWPCAGENEVIIPKGKHVLEIRDGAADATSALFIRSINAEIEKCSRIENGILLKYNSRKNVYMGLNKNTADISVNGEEIKANAFYSGGVFYQLLPPGSNEVKLMDSGTKDPWVSLGGRIASFKEKPVNLGGRFLYPTRELLEAVGAKVTWDAGSRSVTGELNGYVFYCQVDNKTARANGKDVLLDVPPTIINGRVMLPARFIFESLNFKVAWLEDRNLIQVE